MWWRTVLHKSMVWMWPAALMLLAACTFTIQPESSQPESSQPESSIEEATPAPQAENGAAEASAITEFVLPDGTRCLFAGTGATVTFDGKRVNYTCEAVDASESTSTTLAILNDPVIIGPTEYSVDLATVGQTEGGFELHGSEVISFTAWEVVLADGRSCLHAGFGATMGFEGQRLNYTCDKGESSADEVGLMGELVNQGEGVWLAQIDEIGSDANGFTQLSSSQVPVALVSGVEVTPGAESEATPEAVEVDDALLGATWEWVQTVYGDDSVVETADPSRYTLLFDATGQVAMRLECNGGGGDYMVDGSSLLFGSIVSTLLACEEASQVDDFTKDLAEVYSYVIEEGHLYLSLKLDAGIMEFAPAQQSAGSVTPEATEEPAAEATVEPAEEPSEAPGEGAGSSELTGTTWQWVNTIYEGDMVILATDPSRYTLTFNEDGTFGAQLDCNSGGGTYTVNGSTLSLGAIVSTKMACLGDSQANLFTDDLAAVTSYAMADGNLHLTTSTDGVMEFAPVE